MKGGYLTENILYYTKLGCDDKNHTQLDRNEDIETTNEK